MAEGEGNVQGNPTGDVTGQQTQTITPPAWVAQLPDTLKANEVFTKYPTIGDLGKSHLEVMGKIKELDGMTAKVGDLEGRLSKAIIKPDEKATPEQITAYRTAMGVPDKPEGYEFPKRGDEDNDPKLVSWAQNLFFKHMIPKDAAADIGKEWNDFLSGVEAEEDRLMQVEIDEATKKFRGEFPTENEFKTALELNKRYYKKLMGTDMPPFMDAYSITKFIYQHAKKYGEDQSLGGAQTGGSGAQNPGMIYDKTPQHQKK